MTSPQIYRDADFNIVAIRDYLRQRKRRGKKRYTIRFVCEIFYGTARKAESTVH